MCKKLICLISSILVLSFLSSANADLVGHWSLNEGSGSIVHDLSGNGNDGTFVGNPQWIIGVNGGALDFDGESYVDCGNDPAFNVDVFSVSFWCNIANTQGWLHMVSRGQHYGGGNPGAHNWGVMMVNGEEIILFEVFNDTGWAGIRADSSAGDWHHVVATYDGTDMQLYHDGQFQFLPKSFPN